MSSPEWDFLFCMIFLLAALVLGLFNPVFMAFPLGFIFVKLTLDILKKLDEILKVLKEK